MYKSTNQTPKNAKAQAIGGGGGGVMCVMHIKLIYNQALHTFLGDSHSSPVKVLQVKSIS